MRVFKYRGGSEPNLKRDINSLACNQLYAAKTTDLNDIFEASIRIRGETFRVNQLFASGIFSQLGNSASTREDELLQHIENFAITARDWGIYSLSLTPLHDLLWSYYADGHQGFCIEYELDDLLKYKLEGHEFVKVSYEDDVPEIALADLFHAAESRHRLVQKFIGTKSRRWAPEGEVRVVTGQPGLFEYDFRALKAIYFGARSTPSLRLDVMRALAGRGVAYHILAPASGSYALHSEPLKDEFLHAPAYRERVAPVDKGVPHIDSKLEPFGDLVLKAIEIVRRDPYCERVMDAYLSSRGTSQEPIFYVSYLRSDGLARNHFLSKSEIERLCEA